MSNSDIWIISYQSGIDGVRVQDSWSVDHSFPQQDSQRGGQDSLITCYGEMNDGCSIVKFRRLLDTGDECDTIISDDNIAISFALNPNSVDFTSPHPLTNYEQFVINFLHGQSKQLSNWGTSGHLIIGHAVLMFISWGLFVWIAMCLARFFKHIGVWWFRFHILLNVLTTILTITGFILAVLAVNNRWIRDASTVGSTKNIMISCIHAWFGTVVVFSLIAQIILGYLADKLWTKDRKSIPLFPDQLHWWLGRSSMTLALVTIVLGMLALRLEWYWFLAFGIALFIFVVFFLVIALYYHKQGKKLSH
jgi:hypothetical protein